MGQIYIIHFSEPLAHARHYVGFVLGNSPGAPFRRYKEHITGRGARITQVANQRGIKMSVVRVFVNQTREDERRIKRRKGTAQLCPICRMERKAAGPPGGKQARITFSPPPQAECRLAA